MKLLIICFILLISLLSVCKGDVFYFNVSPINCTESKPCSIDDTTMWINSSYPNCTSGTDMTIIMSNSTTTKDLGYVLWNSTCNVASVVINSSNIIVNIMKVGDTTSFDLRLYENSIVNINVNLNVSNLAVQDTSSVVASPNINLQVGGNLGVGKDAVMKMENTTLVTLSDANINGTINGGSYGINMGTTWYVSGHITSPSGSISDFGDVVLQGGTFTIDKNSVNSLIAQELVVSTLLFVENAQYNVTLQTNSTLLMKQIGSSSSSDNTYPTIYQLNQRLGSTLQLVDMPHVEIKGVDHSEGVVQTTNTSLLAIDTNGATLSHLQVDKTQLFLSNSMITYLEQVKNGDGSYGPLIISAELSSGIVSSTPLHNALLNLTTTDSSLTFSVAQSLIISEGSIICSADQNPSILMVHSKANLVSPNITFDAPMCVIIVDGGSVVTPLLMMKYGMVQLQGDEALIDGSIIAESTNIRMASSHGNVTGSVSLHGNSKMIVNHTTTINQDLIFGNATIVLRNNAHLNVIGNVHMGNENHTHPKYTDTVFSIVCNDPYNVPFIQATGNITILDGTIGVSIENLIPPSQNFTVIVMESTKSIWLSPSVVTSASATNDGDYSIAFKIVDNITDGSSKLVVVFSRVSGGGNGLSQSGLRPWEIALIVLSMISLAVIITIFIFYRRRNRNGYHQIG